MARIIYRVLDSIGSKQYNALDEHVLRTGAIETLIGHWWTLLHRAKDAGLLIREGYDGKRKVFWFKARTKGGTSTRRYELLGI